jgi:lipoyl synthase
MSTWETVRFLHPGRSASSPEARSPEYVQLSHAAAITLGLLPGRMHRTECTHCLNLLLTYPEGCRANCAYCGLARHREEGRAYADRNFIRVDWPKLRFEEVIARMKAGGDRGRFERMCISMITHPRSNADTRQLLACWRRELPHVPVSILSNPTTMDCGELQALHVLGADIFTVALDAATPAIFERTRGRAVDSPHRWKKYWQAIEWAGEIFGPERFGAHLICGMGETEREILEVCQRLRDMGGHSHMFAFFPERGSLMEDWPAVDHGQWRRVQLGRFIIDYAGGRCEAMQFDEMGRVVDFGMQRSRLEALINSGKPFRTSGCPGRQESDISACNRPYGDSGPSDILSYPFALQPQDICSVRSQMEGGGVPSGPR